MKRYDDSDRFISSLEAKEIVTSFIEKYKITKDNIENLIQQSGGNFIFAERRRNIVEVNDHFDWLIYRQDKKISLRDHCFYLSFYVFCTNFGENPMYLEDSGSLSNFMQLQEQLSLQLKI